MTTNPLLLAFPNFVKKELREIDMLKELDRALESVVSNEPSQNTEETLKEWLRNHKDIRKQLREFAPSNNREISKVKSQDPKSGVGNVFEELRTAVKEKLENIEEEIKKGK
jgi:hypothetical protein